MNLYRKYLRLQWHFLLECHKLHPILAALMMPRYALRYWYFSRWNLSFYRALKDENTKTWKDLVSNWYKERYE